MKFIKSLSSILIFCLLSSCDNNSNTSVFDYIFSKDYFECIGTISDRTVNSDEKSMPFNSIQSKITVLLDKYKNKLTIDGDDQIQTIGVYFFVCSTKDNITKINGTTCESEVDVIKRLKGYGRKQIDIENWIESKHEHNVWGEFNRGNGDFTVYSSFKKDTSMVEITGSYKCKSKD